MARLLSRSCYIQQRIIHEMLKYISPASSPRGKGLVESSQGEGLTPSWNVAAAEDSSVVRWV